MKKLRSAVMKTAMQRVIVLRRVVLLAAVAIAMLPAIASAQQSNGCGVNCIFVKYQTFLHIDGIVGGSQDPWHRDWMDVLSLRQTYLLFRKTDTVNGNCEIQIVKPLDRAGPKLWADAFIGIHFPWAEIEIMAWTSDRQPWQLYQVRLDDVTIKSIVTTGGQAKRERSPPEG
jgi:type VI protein secretion system component Hcp